MSFKCLTCSIFSSEIKILSIIASPFTKYILVSAFCLTDLNTLNSLS